MYANALPFGGLGPAKPAPRYYADASAATRSAATAFDDLAGEGGVSVTRARHYACQRRTVKSTEPATLLRA
jgi:hypothetical protein